MLKSLILKYLRLFKKENDSTEYFERSIEDIRNLKLSNILIEFIFINKVSNNYLSLRYKNH